MVSKRLCVCLGHRLVYLLTSFEKQTEPKILRRVRWGVSPSVNLSWETIMRASAWLIDLICITKYIGILKISVTFSKEEAMICHALLTKDSTLYNLYLTCQNVSSSSLKTNVVRKTAYVFRIAWKVNFKVSRYQLRIQFAATVGRLYDLNSGFCYKIHTARAGWILTFGQGWVVRNYLGARF